jgi:2-isopropylmalate synthase
MAAPEVTRRDEDRVLIFDTTLRDGEQSAGVSLNVNEKLEIARQLARLGVDIIEAGFPITSPGDLEAVQTIARAELNPIGPDPVICALARTVAADIDAAWRAVKDAGERARIHTFIATSDIHIDRKLQTTRENVKGQVRAAVAHAKGYTDDVEFSPEDGSRSDLEFMAEVIQIALDEGATTINVPDTVGYTLPSEYADMFAELYRMVPDLRKAVVSVHCHDDLGFATANSFAGLEAGCRQVECTVNAIGERAGNASLEEIVMVLHTRESSHGLWSAINTREISRTSRLVSRLTGYDVPPNKAIVGRNAFAHESGIHQDGVLKDRTTYEIMDFATVGLESNEIVLGKHSGRHALRKALAELGYAIDGAALNAAFKRFKEVADRKGTLTAVDLEVLISEDIIQKPATYEIVQWEVHTETYDSSKLPSARVTVRGPAEEERQEMACGDGPIAAFYTALNRATGQDAQLKEWKIVAVTEGEDAIGEATVRLALNGVHATGRGSSTDILEASALAYLRAIDNALTMPVPTVLEELPPTAPEREALQR